MSPLAHSVWYSDISDGNIIRTPTHTMRRHRHHDIAVLLISGLSVLLLVGTPTGTQAQPLSDDIGTLHFSPRLTVSASTDATVMTYLLSRLEGRDAGEQSHPLGKRLRFVRTVSRVSEEILPMVFFDRGSSVIPSRYVTFTGHSQARAYRIDSEIEQNVWDEMDGSRPKYYDLLNVIGSRMAGYSGYTIELEGGYTDEAGESPDLGIERALTVREYLSNVWRIDTSRMAVMQPRPLRKPAPHLLDREEARRVAIHPNMLSLTAPASYRRMQYNNEPFGVQLIIDPGTAPEEIVSMEVVMSNGDRLVGRTPIPVDPDSTVYRYVGLGILPQSVDDMDARLYFQLVVTARSGHTYASEVISIPIEFDDQVQPWSDGRYGSGNDQTAIIPFFEAGDSCLSPYQQRLFEDRTISIGDWARDTTLGRSSVEIDVSTFPTEAAGVDVMAYAGAGERKRGLSQQLISAIEDGEIKSSIYFFPARGDISNEQSNRQQLSESIMECWFGEYNEVIQEKLSTEDISPELSAISGSLSSLAEERIRRVVDAVAGVVDTTEMDVTTRRAVFAWPLSSYGQLFLPELRMYDRRAIIAIRTSYGGSLLRR